MMKQVNRYHPFRTLLLTALLGASLVSCSKQESEPQVPSGDGVIRLNAVVDDADGTKAPIVDGGAGAKVTLSNIHFLRKDGTTTQTNFDGVTALSCSRDASGAITFPNTPPIYAKTDANAWFTAYWPSTSTDGATVTAGSKVVWTINGKTDILLSTLNAAQSYSAGKHSAPVTGTMTFKHALSQLEVICKAVPSTDVASGLVQGMWGNITKIELLTSPADMTYTYATNALTYGAAAAKPLLKSDYNTAFASIAIPDNSSTTITAAGMFPPSTGIIRLKVYSAKFTSGIEIPIQLKDASSVNCNFEAGKRYTVTLTFGADDKPVAVKTTITNWSTGYTAESNPNWSGPRIGSYYYTDGTISWEVVAGKTIEGVIFWVDPADPLHFKLAALKEPTTNWNGNTNSAGNLPISSSATSITTVYPEMVCALADNGAARNSGRANLSMILDYCATNTSSHTIATFPAVNWCEQMQVGGRKGWYLPAMDELQHLYCAYSGNVPSVWTGTAVGPTIQSGYPAAFNTRFTASGVGGETFSQSGYGSSSYVNNTNIHQLSYSSSSAGQASSVAATTAATIRCIKEFPVRTLPPPKPAVLDMSDPELIKSGSMNGTQANITSTTTSYNGYTYNANNANNNGGYITDRSLAFAEPAYHKLEVALANETATAGTIGWSSDGTMANWTTAWDACKAKAPAGAWRLPRTSELALIYLNRTELEKTPGFTAFARGYFYWSSTENNSNISWSVNFSYGYTHTYYKTDTHNVRCVREL